MKLTDMNYYIAAIVIPILIILISYFLRVNKPNSVYEFINFGIVVSLLNIIYSFLLYFFYLMEIWDTGWACYTVWFFSIPILVILVIIHLVYSWR